MALTDANDEINAPRDITSAVEARQRVLAARNNLLAASTGRLDPEIAGLLITGAMLLLDSAAQWLETA